MAGESERKRRATKQTVFENIQEIQEKVELAVEQRKKKQEKTSDLNSLAKDLAHLEKEFRQAFPIKKEKKEKKEGSGPSGLDKPVQVNDALAEFLQLDEDSEPVSYIDIGSALRTYLYRPEGGLSERASRWEYLNPKKVNRDLRDPENSNFYLLDDTLKKLLGYNQYVKDVKAGKIKVLRKSKEFVGKEEVTITDPRISFNTITSLFSKLIIKPEKPVKSKAKAKAKAAAKKGKAAPKKGKKVEEEDDEQSEGDEEEEAPKKKAVSTSTGGAKAKAKSKAAPKKSAKKVEESDEEDEEGDEEEEETPKKKAAPKSKAKAAPKKAPSKKSVKKVIEESEEDEEEDEGEEGSEEEEEDDE